MESNSAVETPAAEQQNVDQQVVETAPVAEVVEEQPKPKIDPFSSKFAALSRREKQIKTREAEVEKKLAEVQTRLKEYEEKQSTYEKLQGRLKSEPLKALEEQGLTYEDLTKMVLNEGNPTPEILIRQMKSEYDKSLAQLKEEHEKQISALRDEYINDKKSEAENQLQSQIDNYKKSLTDFVKSDSKYELIQYENAFDEVYNVIEEYYREHEKILSAQEAADMVETYLEEQVIARANLNKIKSKVQAPKNEQKEKPDSPERQSSVTLSNDLAAQSSNGQEGRISEEERVKRAMDLLKFKQ